MSLDKPKLIKVSKKNTKETAQGLMVKVNDTLYILLEKPPAKEKLKEKKEGKKIKIPVHTPKKEEKVICPTCKNEIPPEEDEQCPHCYEARQKGNPNFHIVNAKWGIGHDDGTMGRFIDVTDKLQAKIKNDKIDAPADVVTLGSFVTNNREEHLAKKALQVTYSYYGAMMTVKFDEGSRIELPINDKQWTPEEKKKGQEAVEKLTTSKQDAETKAKEAVAEMIKKKGINQEAVKAMAETLRKKNKTIESDMQIIQALATKDPPEHKPGFYAIPLDGRPIEHGPFQGWIKAKTHGDEMKKRFNLDVNYYQVMNMGNGEIRVHHLGDSGLSLESTFFRNGKKVESKQ